jgi:hypothetical protein
VALSVASSPKENMLSIMHKLDDKDEFDLIFKDGLKESDGDMIKEMLKDSDMFLIGNK